MPKIVKSISLDEQTAPLAEEKSNFSMWVRHQLLEEISYTIPCRFFKIKHKGKKIFDEESGSWIMDDDVIKEEICNGVRKPTCTICYPNGPPHGEDWLDYVDNRIDKEELLARADARWKWRIDALEQKKPKNEENVPQMGGKTVKRAYVRRLLTWIWSFIW
tara:strand:+ start:220 stop:702 length:483 start_codon:yes stop_codon:yes gene_type:complete